MTTSKFVPVGSVAMFAGDLSNSATKAAVIKAGWLPCDGMSYPKSTYPDLVAVIGTTHGGDANNFNVPKLVDRFPRGTSGSTVVDPNAAQRTVAAPGGASGNAVGSLQQSATALPKNPWVLEQNGDHFHAYQHLDTTMHEVWSGSTDSMARWSTTVTIGAAGGHFHTMSGGDPTTTPVSMALYWLIRAQSGTVAAQTPAAAICAMGADVSAQSPAGWIYCNGMPQALSASSPAFSSAIGSNFGGDGVSVFNVPDLRGQFLRGTSHGTGRDPNAASRHALLGGGNTGDAVGSAQACATSNGVNPITIATTGDHTHAQALVPANDHHAAYGASGPAAYNTMEWTNDWTNTTTAGAHTHGVTGGDLETRPVNLYLDWVIANDVIPDAPPIGAVMAYGGDVTAIDNFAALVAAGWLPCIGQKLKKNDPNYQSLYQIIGNTFGQDNLNFYLPDLRGLLVMGAGGGRKLGNVLSQSTTGQPANPFATTPIGDHTHQVNGIPTDTHEIDVVAGWDLAENNPSTTASSVAGAHTHTLTSGGDAETRPLNIYVDYIIRYK